jgi:phage tail-like protein
LPCSEYLQYLPGLYHRNNLINEILLSIGAIWRPIEEMLDSIHWYSHPLLAPEGMLDYLAEWVDIAFDPRLSIERRRHIIGRAIDLYRWRGTRYGLTEWIRLLTDRHVTIIEAGEESSVTPPVEALPPHGFHVRVEATQHPVEQQLLRRIIEQEKPAYTVYRLEICDPAVD